MITRVKYFFLSCLLITFVFVSCSSDDDNDNTNADKTEAEATLKDGTWRITNFVDSGEDETDNFTGYNFTFQPSGVLNASNGTNDYNGTWSIVDSNSSDDDSSDDLELLINFDLTNDFEELNEDWHFVSHTASRIELMHISGGDGDTDFLSLEKN